MLRSVRKIFELIEIEPESIKYAKESLGPDELIAFLDSKIRKCPVVVTANLSNYFQSGKREDIFDVHAMIAVGVSKKKDLLPGSKSSLLDFIYCKNSYKMDQEKIQIIKFSCY